MLYTVTIQNSRGTQDVDTFASMRKAQNFFDFMVARNFSPCVALYRGQAGEELLARKDNTQ